MSSNNNSSSNASSYSRTNSYTGTGTGTFTKTGSYTTTTDISSSKNSPSSPGTKMRPKQNQVRIHPIREKFDVYKVPVDQVHGIGQTGTPTGEHNFPGFQWNVPQPGCNYAANETVYYATPYQTLQHYFYSKQANVAPQYPIGQYQYHQQYSSSYPFPQMNPNYYNYDTNQYNQCQHSPNTYHDQNAFRLNQSDSYLSNEPYQSSYNSSDFDSKISSRSINKRFSDLIKLMKNDSKQGIQSPSSISNTTLSSAMNALNGNESTQIATNDPSTKMMQEADEIFKKAQNLASRMHNHILSSLELSPKSVINSNNETKQNI
ncbi:hypothetical protein RDWZM_006033 [Blomia tropicalis]|uniref:Uncharacterized protein n=1 Tax=Blomia tropicalis TaxID=40697 RepID=A0A9Q0RMZ4_BLOTA|nr:hypothetical protein RDWZM_006033 [Blomia tropicalis]